MNRRLTPPFFRRFNVIYFFIWIVLGGIAYANSAPPTGIVIGCGVGIIWDIVWIWFSKLTPPRKIIAFTIGLVIGEVITIIVLLYGTMTTQIPDYLFASGILLVIGAFIVGVQEIYRAKRKVNG